MSSITRILTRGRQEGQSERRCGDRSRSESNVISDNEYEKVS